MLYQLSHEATQMGVGQFFGLLSSSQSTDEWKKCIFEVKCLDERTDPRTDLTAQFKQNWIQATSTGFKLVTSAMPVY